MDTTLSEQQLKRLEKAAKVCVNARRAVEVSSFALTLLICAGLIGNEYLVKSEFHSEEKSVGEYIDIDISWGGRMSVLAIRCTTADSPTPKLRQSLEGRMQRGRFPHGLIVHPNISEFYSLDVSADDAEVKPGVILENECDTLRILHFLVSMRK